MVGKLKTITSVEYTELPNVVKVILNADISRNCEDIMPHLRSVYVNDSFFTKDGVDFYEGDLVVNVQCYPDWISMDINDDGEISIYVQNENEDSYDLDVETGQLTFVL